MANFINTNGKETVEVSVEVLLIKEGNYIVSYCPALNLSSFGDTEEDAKVGFEEALTILLDELHERGTLEKTLLNLGWSLKKLPKASFRPPASHYKKPVQRRFNEKVLIPTS